MYVVLHFVFIFDQVSEFSFITHRVTNGGVVGRSDAHWIPHESIQMSSLLRGPMMRFFDGHLIFVMRERWRLLESNRVFRFGLSNDDDDDILWN